MNRLIRNRLSYIYALLTGILGVLILVRLFLDHFAGVDLSTLLAFTLTALMLSYFGVPIGKGEGTLGLDRAVLLGATLAGGPAVGGWAAFVTGLVASIIPIGRSSAHPRHWAESVSTGLLDGGRNVIATALAWSTYLGLEGHAAPATMDTMQSLAIIVLCVAFAVARNLWLWPMQILQNRVSWTQLPTLDNITDILIELIPLPVALLTAATFVKLGWSYYLLLVFVFAGSGALLRQMLTQMQNLQEQVRTAELTSQIRQAIEETPPDLGALGTLAYDLCQRLVPAPRFELGLYDDTGLHVNILVSAENSVKLPSMRIPITAQWAWIGEHPEPHLFQDGDQLGQLPFSLPPIGEEQRVQAAMLVPILDPAAPDIVMGGIALFALHRDTLDSKDLAHIAVIAEQISIAIRRVRQVGTGTADTTG